MTPSKTLPIAVLGAGPVGLAAAARLVERGLEPLVFERGAQAGASVAEWGHVRVFSPWRHNIDEASRALLEAEGWREPDPDALPTGAEIVRDYLAPLAAHPAIAPRLKTRATVLAVTRQDRSKLHSDGREAVPFVVVWRDAEGRTHRSLARALIDASGTCTRPNPIGRDGLAVEGEVENRARIAYGIPDVKGAARADYAGRHILVVGAGHSAINVALDLVGLQEDSPRTRITWATRGGGVGRLLGGGLNDQLPGRGQLGLAAVEAVRSGRLSLLSPLAVRRIEARGDGLAVSAERNGAEVALEVDRIVVATGFRPDLDPLRELRLSLDPSVEATPALAPLIDPNLHSCGTVRPHGVDELAHPEPGFYIVGVKSYGRAPTFLMATGYEQVRSVVAELAGDSVAARQVHLVLPETGVCKVAGPAPAAASCCGPAEEGYCAAARSEVAADVTDACCGGPARENAEACCAADEDAKAGGMAGCGCASTANADASCAPA
ncbi:FAD-dependent oxidoreductase [Roseitranquillus sediminis]|uniref:FAD-dependent oxidoreductase n=1 Tax=Roseitranquillus sediminis TaxID=2809051 RepID=UPI001D0C21DC|nr:FAD-dependent oxidoreductase [Roseitranquillus sediminis]MBM9593583.1 NAD(P)-binding protein [Roseitranquillus sediminis]